MRSATVVLIGIALLGPVALGGALSAVAQEPIAMRTLFEARIDLTYLGGIERGRAGGAWSGGGGALYPDPFLDAESFK